MWGQIGHHSTSRSVLPGRVSSCFLLVTSTSRDLRLDLSDFTQARLLKSELYPTVWDWKTWPVPFRVLQALDSVWFSLWCTLAFFGNVAMTCSSWTRSGNIGRNLNDLLQWFNLTLKIQNETVLDTPHYKSGMWKIFFFSRVQDMLSAGFLTALVPISDIPESSTLGLRHLRATPS